MELLVCHLGQVEYREAAALQERLRERVIAGELPDGGCSPKALVDLVASATQRPQAFLHGPEVVRTVGVISGGAPDSIVEAAELGLDAFITGEVTERTPGLAEELGIHFLAAGHHATERFGVRALGEHLAAKFGVQHTFVDIENPV